MGKDPSKDTDLRLLPPPSLTAETSLLLNYKCNVAVYQSSLDGDLEIALLARQLGHNKCVGILSRDSDFLIYNTAYVPLLLMDSRSSFSDPKVYKCNQDAFACSLGLAIDQLPLVACLMGNDSVPFESVQRFHASLPRTGSPHGNKFFNLLSAVSNIVRPYHRGFSLAELHIRVFGGISDKLSEGVELYWKALDAVPRQETGLFRDIVKSKQLRMMTGESGRFEDYFPTGIEYPRLTKLPPAVTVFRPVRQRYLSMVGRSRVKEFCFYLEGDQEDGLMLEAVPVGVNVQHLSQPNVPDALKWKTFAQLWHFPEWRLEDIKSLPESLQLGLPLPRGLHLGLLVARIFTILTRTVMACNFPIKLESVMPWNVFDGKIMQYYYKQMSKGERFEALSSTEKNIMELICQYLVVELSFNENVKM